MKESDTVLETRHRIDELKTEYFFAILLNFETKPIKLTDTRLKTLLCSISSFCFVELVELVEANIDRLDIFQEIPLMRHFQ